jgi:hypothetical protein
MTSTNYKMAYVLFMDLKTCTKMTMIGYVVTFSLDE